MTFVHRNEWIVYGLLAVAAVAVSLPLYPYRWHLFLHIAGAVIFLGNIIVTGAWMLMAERTQSPSVLHFLGQGCHPRRLSVHLARRAAGTAQRTIHGLCTLGRSISRRNLGNCRPGAVYDVRNHLGWGSSRPSTSHGGTLRTVRQRGLAVAAVLLHAPLSGTSGEPSQPSCPSGLFS